MGINIFKMLYNCSVQGFIVKVLSKGLYGKGTSMYARFQSVQYLRRTKIGNSKSVIDLL